MSHNKKTHEQFLEDLKLKNEHYTNGKFVVSTNYEGHFSKIIVTTEFGDCWSTPSALLQGYMPCISIAVNKSDYFRNMCLKKFGNDNDNLSEVIYVNCKVKIKVIDKDFGEYYITPDSYISGKRCKDRGIVKFSKSLRSDKQSIEDRIKDIHPYLEFDLSEYTSNLQLINVKNKYGVCKVSISNLLAGKKPTIQTSIDKNNYFINQAKEVHGDKYDYSLVEYKRNNIKVKIISEHGIFEQAPSSHLQGNGCPIEGIGKISQYHKDTPHGWSSKNWAEAAGQSKNFTGYKLYFIECFDKDTKERFYKIGRTFVDIKKRFGLKRSMPYNYNIMYILELDDPKRICELEQEYKNRHKEFKYLPTKKFGGMHECFSKIIYI